MFKGEPHSTWTNILILSIRDVIIVINEKYTQAVIINKSLAAANCQNKKSSLYFTVANDFNKHSIADSLTFHVTTFIQLMRGEALRFALKFRMAHEKTKLQWKSTYAILYCFLSSWLQFPILTVLT